MILMVYRCIVLIWELCQLVYNLTCAIFDQIYYLIFETPSKNIDCEIVLITGAGHGLGKEMALYLLKFRPVMVLWDIDPVAVERTANEIRRRGGVAYPFEVDVGDYEAVMETARRVRESVGDVYLIINNAGILNCKKFFHLQVQKIEMTMRVNLLSQFWIAKAFLPQIIEKRRGHIVAISSNRGLFGRAFFTDYSASKFGIIGFMQALEDEVRAMELPNIIFTTVCPSAIDTGLSRPFETRFPSFLPIMETDYAAKYIIDEVLKDRNLVVFPIGHKVLFYLLRDLPKPIFNLFIDFIGYSVQPNPPSPLPDAAQ